MSTLITVIHVMTCFLLVLVILLQSGKGAEISASFGGSSQTVFGSSGGVNFFVKFTAVAATVFMVTSMWLTLMGGSSRKSLFETPSAAPVVNTTKAKPTGATAPSGASAPSGAQKAVPTHK